MDKATKTAYLVVGCPGSGKTWVCEQIKHLFAYVHHDLFIGMAGDAYVQAILHEAKLTEQPLLIEAPFSISQIKEPLERAGLKIIPVVISEAEGVIENRYLEREGKLIPNGHISRQATYLGRAKRFGWFYGTSAQCAQHLGSVLESDHPQQTYEPRPIADSPWSIVYEKAIKDDGSLYFPERLSQDVLDRARRQMGSYLFANQYLNVIVPDEERRFKKEWLRYTTIVPPNTYNFGFIDPAIGQKKTNDYTGVAIISVDHQGNWYLKRASRHRLTPTQIVNLSFDLCKQYKLDCLGVEAVAYQEALLYLISEEMGKRQTTIPLKDIKRTQMSKETRILALVPRFEWSRIFCLPGFYDFEEEYLAFPRGSHDDILDALASLEEIVYYPTVEEKKLEQPHSPHDPEYERWVRQQLVERANSESQRDSVEGEFGF